MVLKFETFHGNEARPYFESLVALKLATFSEFPFLYTGSLDTERQWLETYFQSARSFILIVKSGDKVIGACTGICGQDEDENFTKPLIEQGIDPALIFFFGESMILPEYRGQGFGKFFYEQRNAYALSLPDIKASAACMLERSVDHPLAPPTFESSRRTYEKIWEERGFILLPELHPTASWRDRDSDKSSTKTFQIWMKLNNQKDLHGSDNDREKLLNELGGARSA